MRTVIFIALALVCASVCAQEQSTNSSGDYMEDLGQVYGGIRSIKNLGEICTSHFPQEREANTEAYLSWRKKYLSFLQEIEKYRTALVWKEFGGDQTKYVNTLQAMDASLDKYKDSLEQQLMSGGSDKFAAECRLYPTYLQTPRTDLEHYYLEQVQTVRAYNKSG